MTTTLQPQFKLTQQGDTAAVAEHQQALYLLLREFDRACGVLGLRYFLYAGTLLGAVRHKGFIPWDDDLDVLMPREDYERFLREAPAVLDGENFFLQGEFSAHWPLFFSKFRLNNTACLEKYYPKDPATHQGVYMDIFPCDRAFDSGLGRKLQFLASKVVIAKGLYKRGYETESLKKKIFMQLCRPLPNGLFHRIVKGPGRPTACVHSFLGGASKYEKSIFPAAYFENSVLLDFEQGQYPAPADYDGLLRTLYGDYMRLPSEEERGMKKHAVLVDLTRSYEEYEHYRDNMKFDVQIRSIR